MTKKMLLIMAIAMSGLVIVSCSKQDKAKKPRSIGNTSEILVVVDNEVQWDNGIGKVIRETFEKDQYALNQSEPLFSLSHVQKQSFSELFQKHHNLFIVDIQPEIKESKIETSVDFWAQPQRIFKITAASSDEFIKVFEKNTELFLDSFQQTDRDRIMEVFRPLQNTEAVAEVQKACGLNIVIPKDFYLAKNVENFIWIRKEAGEFSQGIFIIPTTYHDTAQFSKESIMARINQNLKANVPGAVYNSYMSTDEEFMPPASKVLKDFPSGYAIEIAGLWTVENDFMGGPFKSYTFFDKKTGNIITLMAYVYKPNEKKRDLLKQLEAILYSVQVS